MAKRTTRLTSIAEETNFAKIIKRREDCIAKIDRIERHVNDQDKFLDFEKDHLDELLLKIEEQSAILDKIHMKIICDHDEDKPDDYAQTSVDMDDKIFILRVKIKKRLDMIRIPSVQQQSEVAPMKFQVQMTDASGNVPNTWGTFDGEYEKWQSFRDRWIAAMHNNENVPAITKFQNLKAACVGQANGALGEWDLTEENYNKAWERLQAIYEDDYMQMQAFMLQLDKLPTMNKASSVSIRNLLDTVHQHIHGVERYVKVDEKHPYVVFAVINRMDTETYRAWEKHRPTLAKASTQTNESFGNNDTIDTNIVRPGKHIPTWNELEQFLESEVTIRVHAEKRNDGKDEEITNPSTKQYNFKHQNFENKQRVREFLQCVLCDDIHPIYRCESFKAMNLTDRKEHVNQNNLCQRCLRKNHDGRCDRKENNEECPKCKPASKFHNSLLCPSSELKLKLALLARENQGGSKKRKYQSESDSSSDSNSDSSSDSDEDMQSHANKIGYWAYENKHE